VDSAGDPAWEGRIVQTKKGQKIWLNASYAKEVFGNRLRKELPGARQSDDPSPEQASEQMLEVPS